MSDNWNPPPGRDPSEPDGDQSAGREGTPRRDGQSPRWWTESTEKPQEYLRPGPAGPQNPAQPGPVAPGRSTPGESSAGTQPGRPAAGTPGQQSGGQPGNPGWNLPPYSRPDAPRGQHAAPPPTSPRPPAAGGSGSNGPGGPGISGRATPGTGSAGPGISGAGATGRPGGPTSSWPSASTGPVRPQPTNTWPGPIQGPTGPGAGSSAGGAGNPWAAAAGGGYQPQNPQGGWQQPQPGGDQPPSWQYPPIPIPKPPGPGRRKKSRRFSKGLLIGLVALAVLAVGSGVTVALQLTDDDPTAPVAVDTPSQTPSETPSETPSATPSPTPTPTPPPKPKPKPRQPTPYELVARNKLYAIGTLQPTKCVEPPYRPTTFPATKAYYQRLLPCLNRTWWLAMRKAGVPFRAPNLIVYANQVKTPCGIERGTRGFYCAANEAIYMPFNVDYKNYRINPMYTRAWMLNTFAHEYGHHVQQLTGIFRASFARQATMADPNLRLLESRRRELQASCLGSAYLGINAPYIPLRGALLSSWKFAVANAGDEFSRPRVRDHGSKANHNLWSNRGLTYKNPKYCNTFNTPPQYTS